MKLNVSFFVFTCCLFDVPVLVMFVGVVAIVATVATDVPLVRRDSRKEK